MESQAYLIEVLRTVSPHNTPKTNLLGLRGETGEVADVVKKAIGHAQGWEANDNRGKLVKELGDSCWYAVAALIKILGEEVTAGVMRTRYFIPESMEDLADMLCEAGSRIGHAAYPFEAQDAGQEFFAIVHTIACHHMDMTFGVEKIWEANVAKLRKRYPEGFTTAASLIKADEKPSHASIDGALEFEVDNHATAGHGYPPKPVGTFEEARALADSK